MGWTWAPHSSSQVHCCMWGVPRILFTPSLGSAAQRKARWGLGPKSMFACQIPPPLRTRIGGLHPTQRHWGSSLLASMLLARSQQLYINTFACQKCLRHANSCKSLASFPSSSLNSAGAYNIITGISFGIPMPVQVRGEVTNSMYALACLQPAAYAAKALTGSLHTPTCC